MSKRFGRNQKRRMRAEVACANAESLMHAQVARDNVAARIMAQSKLRDMQQMLEEIAGMVGRKSLAAGEPTKFEVTWLKTGQKNFVLPAPIFAQTNYCAGRPSPDEMSLMVHQEIMRLLEVETIRNPISRMMHVRVLFDDISMGYALSDAALFEVPEEILARRMASELFPLLLDAVRKMKGKR